MKLKLLILILALQAAWILGTTFQQERAWRVGKTVMLETERVDPRDLLRGDYLILNYKISSIPIGQFTPSVSLDMEYGTKVYVALVPSTNQFHTVARASTNEFAPAVGEILAISKSAGRLWNVTNSIHVEYGLERYYVAEGTGNPTGKLTVQAIVPSSGRASIKQLFMDGKPYAEAMRENQR